jgi:hypothetical protein
MRAISIIENPIDFSSMIRPMSPSVRGLTSLFPDAWAFIVGIPIAVIENAD